MARIQLGQGMFIVMRFGKLRIDHAFFVELGKGNVLQAPC